MAQYGSVSAVTNGEIVEFTAEEIIAGNDEVAVERAENQAEVMDVLENLKPGSRDITRHVVLVSVRNQRDKRVIHFCGRLSDE